MCKSEYSCYLNNPHGMFLFVIYVFYYQVYVWSTQKLGGKKKPYYPNMTIPVRNVPCCCRIVTYRLFDPFLWVLCIPTSTYLESYINGFISFWFWLPLSTFLWGFSCCWVYSRFLCVALPWIYMSQLPIYIFSMVHIRLVSHKKSFHIVLP